MPDGAKLLLPEVINRVPALLLINKNNNVIFGEDVKSYFRPKIISDKKIATNFNDEPMSFTFGNDVDNVVSDTFSFLDQKAEDFMETGNGGMRQMYNYVSINDNFVINCPPEDYVPDKVNSTDFTKYKEQREKELKFA
tara:strand:+ start:9013 stop:9426 length:414 start_codon:yes stop_codon:yes gene_type:complete